MHWPHQCAGSQSDICFPGPHSGRIDTKKTIVGIELDLDSLIDMPSSFATPSGFSVEEARLYIRQITAQLQPAYLHLPEGAPMTGNFEESRVGKTLAYLVADFIKSFNP